MKELENKILVLENNEKYSVIESVIYNKKIYVYLVNINDETDSMFKEVNIDNEDIELEDIDTELFKNNIINLFIDKLKNS